VEKSRLSAVPPETTRRTGYNGLEPSADVSSVAESTPRIGCSDLQTQTFPQGGYAPTSAAVKAVRRAKQIPKTNNFILGFQPVF
jgi:hypothetical protein